MSENDGENIGCRTIDPNVLVPKTNQATYTLH
jgi:hypothetical protein